MTDAFEMIEQFVPLQRRMLHAGDAVFRCGDRFAFLHLVHAGSFKAVVNTADGREKVMSLHLKGDWLGFDGIAHGSHECEMLAMDTGEVWSVRYESFLRACAEHPELLTVLHRAMSREIARDRVWLTSLCTLSADARVAEFLRSWAESLEGTGLRTDSITLRMTRAEIGSYLGMTLETVSRAMSRLAREEVIRFSARGRREVHIPDVGALGGFVQRSLCSGALQ